MRKKLFKNYIIEILTFITIIFTGTCGIVFCCLYIENYSAGFIKANIGIINALIVSLISVFCIFSVVFLRLKNKLLFKFTILFVILVTISVVMIFYLTKSGFFNKIKSVNDFSDYIYSFGDTAVLYFIIIQFLQVVVLPIPAFITVGAGALLFGPFKGAFFSCIGIIFGSVVAYFIGKVFGYKTLNWLIGKERLEKTLKTIRGKDKVVLTFMFLFPFFPDDMLCFAAGITTISPSFFCIMIVITRIASVFTSSYSLSNRLIPFNTWWGITLWILFFAFTLFITKIILKYTNKEIKD